DTEIGSEQSIFFKSHSPERHIEAPRCYPKLSRLVSQVKIQNGTGNQTVTTGSDKPVWSAEPVPSGDAPPSHAHAIKLGERACELPQPLGRNFDIVVRKGNDFTCAIRDTGIPSARGSLARLEHISDVET